MTDLVRLKCVAEGRRLRVKIISHGYNSEANCQFPRDIRLDGREYLVPVTDVKFSEMNCKFFYRIGRKNIQIIDDVTKISSDLSNLKIYGDVEGDQHMECCICFCTCSGGGGGNVSVSGEDNQMVVFAPCGHYCCCLACANKINKCPLCRGEIQHRVTRDQLALSS